MKTLKRLKRWGIHSPYYGGLLGHKHENGAMIFSSLAEAQSELRQHPREGEDVKIVKVEINYDTGNTPF